MSRLRTGHAPAPPAYICIDRTAGVSLPFAWQAVGEVSGNGYRSAPRKKAPHSQICGAVQLPDPGTDGNALRQLSAATNSSTSIQVVTWKLCSSSAVGFPMSP